MNFLAKNWKLLIYINYSRVVRYMFSFPKMKSVIKAEEVMSGNTIKSNRNSNKVILSVHGVEPTFSSPLKVYKSNKNLFCLLKLKPLLCVAQDFSLCRYQLHFVAELWRNRSENTHRWTFLLHSRIKCQVTLKRKWDEEKFIASLRLRTFHVFKSRKFYILNTN